MVAVQLDDVANSELQIPAGSISMGLHAAPGSLQSILGQLELRMQVLGKSLSSRHNNVFKRV
jgi:hypothetical protein